MAGNTAQPAKGKAPTGSWEGCRDPCAQAEEARKEEGQPELKQAGEKLKDTGKEVRDGLRRWT
jgi:hypothetical protein